MRESKTVLDSGFFFQDSLGFRFLPMEVGLRIVIVSAGDSEFIERYTGFQNPGFQIPQARFSQISDSTSKNFADPGSGYSYTGKSASFYRYLKLLKAAKRKGKKSKP